MNAARVVTSQCIAQHALHCGMYCTRLCNIDIVAKESADACTTVEPTPPKLAKSVDQHVQEHFNAICNGIQVLKELHRRCESREQTTLLF
eukprot:3091721-Amphidinium_carterae.1